MKEGLVGLDEACLTLPHEMKVWWMVWLRFVRQVHVL